MNDQPSLQHYVFGLVLAHHQIMGICCSQQSGYLYAVNNGAQLVFAMDGYDVLIYHAGIDLRYWRTRLLHPDKFFPCAIIPDPCSSCMGNRFRMDPRVSRALNSGLDSQKDHGPMLQCRSVSRLRWLVMRARSSGRLKPEGLKWHTL
jgi:hypothetical protein